MVHVEQFPELSPPIHTVSARLLLCARLSATHRPHCMHAYLLHTPRPTIHMLQLPPPLLLPLWLESSTITTTSSSSSSMILLPPMALAPSLTRPRLSPSPSLAADLPLAADRGVPVVVVLP